MSDASEFDTDRRHARELLADDDLTALHLGVVHEDETVDTVVSRTGEGDERLQALSLLATHIRSVAAEAGADPEAVAADAAAIAGQLDDLSVKAMTDATEGDDTQR
ncbi:MAG: hypothetical protein A07HN63_01916 [uncultured archaeon A07HN63]|nr:MAG: hypothetical protein A07HN63_01916 [uncultured archaeon A07HN63]